MKPAGPPNRVILEGVQPKRPRINTRFPEQYYCAERTLDIPLIGCGRKIRLWLDAKTEHWPPVAMVTLAKGLRRNPQLRTCAMELVVDWCATLDGVNAVQVQDYLEGGYSVGVMAYLVPFEEESRITKVVRDLLSRVTAPFHRRTS